MGQPLVQVAFCKSFSASRASLLSLGTSADASMLPGILAWAIHEECGRVLKLQSAVNPCSPHIGQLNQKCMGTFPCVGQGYIWLAHRDPASAAWQLARESCARWERLLRQPHLSPSRVEWPGSGSLLLATAAAEAEQLRARQEMLGAAGVSARYLDERALRCEEPALHDGLAGGLLVSSDSQLVRPAIVRQS